MAGIFSGARLAVGMAGIGPTLGAVAAVFTLGFAAAEIYEHTVPWGLGPQKERLLLQQAEKVRKADSDGFNRGARRQREMDQSAFDKWGTSLRECRTDLRTASETAARQLTDAQAANARSRSAAYRLGQASCGAENAKPSTDRHSGAAGPVPGSLQHDPDLRAVLAGAAYAPGRP